MNTHITPGVVPFSLANAPSLMERIFPSMKISAEAEKERDAKQSQTLTQLGAYWKGRKPLVLVRACVLGCLLPATHDLEEDLKVFEALMCIDDNAFRTRVKKKQRYPAILERPYEERLAESYRPEELTLEPDPAIWATVNGHLGTNASSIHSLVEQLGIMRFGKRPVVGDTFSGGGSIPFEAGRMGCDVYASDLNPIACMLSWGAFNVIGASEQTQAVIAADQSKLKQVIDTAIEELGIEYDELGNRAKAYLYCVEVRCPVSGWLVPVLPTRIISKSWKTVVDLIPDEKNQRYNFVVKSGVSDEVLRAASTGTLVNSRLVHAKNPDNQGVSIPTIRGDYRLPDGTTSNNLRQWSLAEFMPTSDDIFQDRLYAVLWIDKDEIGKTRPKSFFASPTPSDLEREVKVEKFVRENLDAWQRDGFVPDMAIENGDETTRLSRERGWTHWHHLFTPRQLLYFATFQKAANQLYIPTNAINLCRLLDRSSKINKWSNSNGSSGQPTNVFDDQSLKTVMNYGIYTSYNLNRLFVEPKYFHGRAPSKIYNIPANNIAEKIDLAITDPPYADAVNYHEITEFFIAWLRRNPQKDFKDWNWDSRRKLAIKGKGEGFRAGMVNTYRAIADSMPENGVQIVMFTHQDGKVWSDMAQIFWGAGLQVMADWYIATETSSELKKGGYVQGTHIIVLRKRRGTESGYSDEITQEVKDEVARQIDSMVGLNQSLKGHGRSENLFNDADLQMAGYAAALRVLTRYSKIDGKDMTVEAIRPRPKNERTVIDDVIEYAVQVANEHLVPEGMTEPTWRKLVGAERFYLKMMDIETTGTKKIDNYQNFAKAFRVSDYSTMMASVAANDARLKTSSEFGKRQMGDDEFGSSITRAVLYGLWELKNAIPDEIVVGHVRDLVKNYSDRREDVITVANYVRRNKVSQDREEATNAEILIGLLRNERIT